MREINFRAWIKTGNETDDYVEPMTIQQMIHSKKSTFSLAQLNDLVDFEQYTGLTDANGNDVYEGDIVHCENDYQGTDYTGKVMFFNGGFCVWTGGFRNYVWDDMIPEIIGNIHENPELLEVRDDQ